MKYTLNSYYYLLTITVLYHEKITILIFSLVANFTHSSCQANYKIFFSG